MNVERLNEIIVGTTEEYRKGAERVDEELPGVRVTHVFAMPHVDDAPIHEWDLDMVDVHFIVVAVDLDAAKPLKDELVGILNDWPEGRIKGGPSFIEIGGVLGSQDLALRLIALGQSLELWTAITPEKLGMEGAVADRAAGAGYVMCSGLAGA